MRGEVDEGQHPDLLVKYHDDSYGSLTRSHAGDAGLDLFCSQDMEILPGRFEDIPVGVSVELPEGFWGLLTGRSSTLRKRGLMVAQGVIDQGYRGPLFTGVWNLTPGPVKVSRGERLAQLILVPLWEGGVEPVLFLSESSRGSAGFGSSGL